MADLRRWYTYLVSAITVQAVVWALILLVWDILDPLFNRESVAVELAIIVVALPLFLVHWLWANRAARQDPEERASFPRQLYLYGMLATFLAPALVHAYGALRTLLYLVVGVSRVSVVRFFAAESNGAVLRMTIPAVVVLAAGWLFHWSVKREDDRQQVESEAAAILRDLYTFGFALAGLLTTAVATGLMLRWGLNQLLAGSLVLEPAREFFPAGLSQLAIGLPLWLAFWLPAQRAFAAADRQARESVVRKTYLYLATFAGAVVFISTVSALLADVLERLFRVPAGEGNLSTALALIAVSGGVWAYHAFVLRQDAAAEAEVQQQALVRRIYTYLMAGLGLAALLIGLAGILTVLFQALDEGALSTDLRRLLADFLAVLLAGLAVWLWQWTPVVRVVHAPPPAGIAEQRSFVRRFYLYLYIFAATMAILGSAIYIVSQLLMVVLGARELGGLLFDLAQAIAYAILAVALWVYHGLMLRQDQQAVAAAEVALQRRLRVAVVDAGDGTLGRAVQEQLHKKVPGAIVQPLGLTPAAMVAMNGGVVEKSPLEMLAEAEVIVGPWSIAVPAGHGGIVPADFAAAVNASPAYKILMPEPETGMSWAGVEPWKMERVVRDVATNVRALSLNEDPAGARRLAPWAIVLIVLVSLCILLNVVPSLLSLLIAGTG